MPRIPRTFCDLNCRENPKVINSDFKTYNTSLFLDIKCFHLAAIILIIVAGGYYIIERKTLKLQIVVLNTNLMRRNENDDDAAKQWKWLDKVFQKFQRNGETVSFLFTKLPSALIFLLMN